MLKVVLGVLNDLIHRGKLVSQVGFSVLIKKYTKPNGFNEWVGK